MSATNTATEAGSATAEQDQGAEVKLLEISGTPGFLTRIQLALTPGMGDICEPDGKVKKGEKPIAVLTNLTLRGLYSLMVKLGEEARSVIPSKMPRRASEHMAIHEKLEEVSQRIKKVSDLFWDSVRDSLGEHAGDVSSIGIREGWQIVACADDEGPEAKARSLIQSAMESLVEQLREQGYTVAGGEVKSEGNHRGGSFFDGLFSGRGRG